MDTIETFLDNMFAPTRPRLPAQSPVSPSGLARNSPGHERRARNLVGSGPFAVAPTAPDPGAGLGGGAHSSARVDRSPSS